MRYSKLFIPLLVVIMVSSTACQAVGLGEPTVTPTLADTATLTVSPTPTITLTPSITPTSTELPPIAEPEPPDSASANVFGRVLWQGRPVEGIQVSVIGSRADGEWGNFEAVTDAEGFFLIENLPAPKYYYLFQVSTVYAPDWMDDLNVGSESIRVEPTMGENYPIGDYLLVDTGLALIEPERQAIVSDQPPLLQWERYPGADYYVVTLAQSLGDYTDVELETTETSLPLEGPLLRCLYGWNVSAFAADGTLLARSGVYTDDEDEFQSDYDGIFQFESAGVPPCQMEIVKPSDYQSYMASSGQWEVQWELIPWAAAYRVVIRRSQDAQGNIDIETIPTSRFYVDENGQPEEMSLPALTPGIYKVYVVAYDEDGAILSQTEERFIRIY